MLFHTWTFVIFFILVYALYLPLRHTRLKLPLLLTASYVFYGWWNPLYLLLIAGCTALNFYAVVLMRRTRFRRFWFTVSLVGSLGALGYFKYAGFLMRNLDHVLAFLGSSWRVPAPGVLLPVGISFFTFQAMSYTID
jgi:alginate O-acetyltransferase complex protein AlgI